MEKKIKIFKSKEEAEEADRQYYLSLTPEERMKIMLELNARQPGASDGFKRVYRVFKRSQG